MLLPLRLLDKLKAMEFLLLEVIAEESVKREKNGIELPQKWFPLTFRRTAPAMYYVINSLIKKGYLERQAQQPFKPSIYKLPDKLWKIVLKAKEGEEDDL